MISYRVLKCDVIMGFVMGFVRMFRKSNVQEAYLPKMSIVSEIVAQLCLENSIQTLVNFFGGRPNAHF